MSKNALSRLLFVALAFGAFAYPPRAPAGEDVVKFGVCLSLTGEFQDYGRINLAGIRLFLDDFNARSAENGYRLEMLLRDDRSDPAAAAAIVEELAVKEEVQAIIGPTTSGIMAAMAEKAKLRPVVLLSPAATSPHLGKADDWCFKVLFGDDRQGAALGRFAARNLGYKTCGAIVNDSYVYGDSLFRAFRRAFEAEGGRIVADERYEWNLDVNDTPDFTGILAMVKAAKPDMVLLPGYAEEAAAIIHQSLAVGVETTFVGGDAWLNQKVILASGNNLEGAYYVGGADIYADHPVAKRFATLFDNSNDPDAELSSVNGYDCMLLLAEALKRGRDAAQIRDALYALDRFRLVAGTISFDRESGTEKSLFIHRIAREGDDFASRIVAEIEPE